VDQDLLCGFRPSFIAGPFDELAAGEGRPSADQGDEVGRVHGAPAVLADGVSTKELAEYLGHSDPAFTLRVYAHMLPCSHDRARAVISERFSRVIGSGS
jgi:integrase